MAEITTDRLREMQQRLREIVDEYLPAAYVDVSQHNADENLLTAIGMLDNARKYVEIVDGSEYDVVQNEAFSASTVHIVGYGRHRPSTDLCWLCREYGADARDGLKGQPVHHRCIDSLARLEVD